MQASFQVPCEMSSTGKHTVTVTMNPEDGRVTGFRCPCEPTRDENVVARSLGSATCGDLLHLYRETVQKKTGYGAADAWEQLLRDRSKEAGFSPVAQRQLLAMLLPAVTAAVRAKEERVESTLPVAAGRSDREHRLVRMINAVAKADGLRYRLRAKHYPGEGVKIQTEYADKDGRTHLWRTIAIAPTGSKIAYAVRTHDVIGEVKVNRESDKPNWCAVCGAPIRGLHRHANSVPHRAKVRRDVFRLVKAVWPHRTVREAFLSQLPQSVEPMLAIDEPDWLADQ
jgi:ribosomal protein L34E